MPSSGSLALRQKAAAPGDETTGQDSPTPAQDQTRILDTHGDLWLHAQGTGSWGDNETVKFKVCSRALARASVVFDAMLYGRFAESEKRVPGADWVVELPDDSGAAMEQLLGIMHDRFRSLDVPCYQREKAGKSKTNAFKTDEPQPVLETESSSTSMQVAQLYDLTVLADKYDCIHILQPWAAAWVSSLGALPEDPLNEQVQLRKAWVYYQLGDRIKYERVVTSLILDVPPWCDADDEKEELPQALPPGLLGAIHHPLSSAFNPREADTN